MSIAATTYVDQVLEDDDQLTTTARLVLMLMAGRANSQTGVTYTGPWLEARTAKSRSTLWRAMVELRRSGAVEIVERPGFAHLVRFPVVSKLSTPVAPARQVSEDHPSRWRGGYVAPARRVSGSIPGIENARDTHDPACACDATGWIHDPASRTVSPCPEHDPRRKSVGS